MKQRVLIGLVFVFAGGCAHGPFRVVMRGDLTTHTPTEHTASRLTGGTLPGMAAAGPAVAVIDIDGLLVNQNMSGFGSLGENPVALFREKLEAAAANPEIQAVVLRIHSPGGGVTATDIMRRDLVAFRRMRGVPIVACLMDVATGGAYYIATAADTILAHPTTITGGIGVILNVYNLEDTLGQYNVVPIPVKAGGKIDMATPVRSMEKDERDLLEQIAREFHQRFQQAVRQARPQLTATAEAFDGRVFTASQAQQMGLVDGIGYLDDALQAARALTNCPSACRVVMFRRSNDRAFTLYDTTPNVPLQNSLLPLNVPGLDRSALPTFLYLWQADPSYVTRGGAR